MSVTRIPKAELDQQDRRLCPICRHYFAPKFREQKTCGSQCGRRLVGRIRSRQIRERGLPAVFRQRVEARKREFQLRIKRDAFRRFGVLSPREVDVFAFAEAFGYQRGYAAGYNGSGRHKRKKGRAA